MKKILTTLILGFILIVPNMALAQAAPTTANPDTQVKNEIDKLFTIQKVTGTGNLQQVSGQVTSNQEASYSDLFAGIIKILTGVAVIMTFVGITVAGGFFVFSEGEEGRITKARTIIIYVIVGDLIIAVSYAVVKGITLIKPLS